MDTSGSSAGQVPALNVVFPPAPPTSTATVVEQPSCIAEEYRKVHTGVTDFVDTVGKILRESGHGLDDDRLSKLLFSLGSLPLTSEAELSQNAQQLTCFILTALTVIAEIMKKTVIKHPTSAEPQASSSEGGDHSSMKKVEHKEPQDSSGEGGDHISMKTEEHVKEEPALSPDQISMETGSHDIPVHFAIVQGLSASSSHLSEDSFVQQTQIHQRDMTTTKLESVLSERGRPKKLLSSFNCDVQASKMGPGIVDNTEVNTLSKTTEKVIGSRRKRGHPRKSSVYSTELIETSLGVGGGTTTSERKTTRKRGRPRKSPASFGCDILSRETRAIIWDNSVSVSHRASEREQLENGPSLELGASIETDVMVSVSETGHEDDQHKRCSDIQLGETEPGVENKRNVTVVSEREHEGKRGQPQKYGPHRKVGRPPKLVKDTDCPQEFVTRGLLHNHVKTNHSAEAESLMCYFLCPQCGKTFTFKHNLAVHLRRHQSIKPYACSHCQSSFTAAVDLNHHVAQKHCDARPFVCSICAKSFKVYPGLRRHMQTHGGTREYTCHICGKLFTRRSNVKQHIAAIHTAMKPYKCHLCEAAYTRKSGLGLHLRSARHRSSVADNGTAETTGTS